MKTCNKLSTLLGVLFMTVCLTTSCVNSLSEENIPETDRIPIRISSPIMKFAQTRMSGTEFQTKDTIGVFVLKQSGTLLGERHLNNEPFICSSSGFAPKEPVYYPAGGGKYDFYSYYPYRKAGVDAKKKAIQVDIKSDQRLAFDHFYSDFLVAKTTGITPTEKVVKLSHKHKMCQLAISIELKGDGDIQSFKAANPQVVIRNAYTRGQYDFSEDTTTVLERAQDIFPYGEWTVNDNKLEGKKAILIPQAILENTEFIELSVEGRTFSGKLSDKFQLQKGTICHLMLSYTPKVGISGLVPSIDKWDEGGGTDSVAVEEVANEGFVRLGALNFEETSVFDFVYEGKVIATACKEYLRSDNVDSQAIVIYPSSDLTKGTVLYLVREEADVHGGTVEWNTSANTVTYVPGKLGRVRGFYFTENQSLSLEKPEKYITVTVRKRLLEDVRGGKTATYPVVKIGTQYWMQANLQTDKYSDGTAIPALELADTKAGYRKEDTQFYYNQMAVAGGKLAPAGWGIPTEAHWIALDNYIGKKTSVLKNGIWDGDQLVTNMTDFNGQATGYFVKDSKSETSTFAFKGKFSAFWRQKAAGVDLFILSYKGDTLNFVDAGVHNAAFVRCILTETK